MRVRVEYDESETLSKCESKWNEQWFTVQESCLAPREGRGKNPKNVWWNDLVKAAVKRNEGGWKEVLGARDEATKDRFMEIYKRKEKS